MTSVNQSFLERFPFSEEPQPPTKTVEVTVALSRLRAAQEKAPKTLNGRVVLAITDWLRSCPWINALFVRMEWKQLWKHNKSTIDLLRKEDRITHLFLLQEELKLLILGKKLGALGQLPAGIEKLIAYGFSMDRLIELEPGLLAVLNKGADGIIKLGLTLDLLLKASCSTVEEILSPVGVGLINSGAANLDDCIAHWDLKESYLWDLLKKNEDLFKLLGRHAFELLTGYGINVLIKKQSSIVDHFHHVVKDGKLNHRLFERTCL